MTDRRLRFPDEIISHAAWLYFRFLLSYGDVEELLAERGIAVSYETVRRWCRKLGQAFADGRRRRRPGSGRYAARRPLGVGDRTPAKDDGQRGSWAAFAAAELR